MDRLWQGAVTDFLDFHLGGWHWPAFNAADSAITVGIACLVVQHFVPRSLSQG
jgi:signal peptidase II